MFKHTKHIKVSVRILSVSYSATKLTIITNERRSELPYVELHHDEFCAMRNSFAEISKTDEFLIDRLAAQELQFDLLIDDDCIKTDIRFIIQMERDTAGTGECMTSVRRNVSCAEYIKVPVPILSIRSLATKTSRE
jgi:hypothetical protein